MALPISHRNQVASAQVDHMLCQLAEPCLQFGRISHPHDARCCVGELTVVDAADFRHGPMKSEPRLRGDAQAVCRQSEPQRAGALASTANFDRLAVIKIGRERPAVVSHHLDNGGWRKIGWHGFLPGLLLAVLSSVGALADKAPKWTPQEEAGLYFLLDTLIATKACGNACVNDAQYFRNKLIQAPQSEDKPNPQQDDKQK
jgi:hypothetical protein